MRVWRLGFARNPCGFVPRRLCKWHHRFDDPLKQYRTLYAAQNARTCLRELLADLRPNPKAIAEFEALFHSGAEPGLAIAGVVSAAWRRHHVLAHARVVLEKGRLVNVESPAERKRLYGIHQTLLRAYGVPELDLRKIRSRERVITQNISRALFAEGRAGVVFGSRLDEKRCVALFEGRSRLLLLGRAIPMTQDHPDLVRVCSEYSLILRPT